MAGDGARAPPSFARCINDRSSRRRLARARSLEPAEPHRRPIRMKNAICKVWNSVTDRIDAAIEVDDGWIDQPGRTNRFAQPDVILPSSQKADLQ